MERQGGWLPGDLVVAGLGEAVLELGDVDVLTPGFFALARGLGGLEGRGAVERVGHCRFLGQYVRSDLNSELKLNFSRGASRDVQGCGFGRNFNFWHPLAALC